jgi:transcription initiation factor TFIID TATA-box-binding protein
MDDEYGADDDFDFGLDDHGDGLDDGDDVGDAHDFDPNAQRAAGAGGGASAASQRLAAVRGALRFESTPPRVDVARMFPDSNDTARPRIVNTLATLTLGRVVDLRILACNARNVEYDPHRHAAVMRLREPPCAALIRVSGACMIAGAASVPAAKRAAVLIARVVRAVMGWRDELKTVTFAVKSIMVRFDLRHPVRLEELAQRRPEAASYEPETFCGCTVKMRGIASGVEWAAACNVYVSGKINITGVRSMEALQAAYDAVLPVIAECARGANPSAPPLSDAVAAPTDDTTADAGTAPA